MRHKNKGPWQYFWQGIGILLGLIFIVNLAVGLIYEILIIVCRKNILWLMNDPSAYYPESIFLFFLSWVFSLICLILGMWSCLVIGGLTTNEYK